MINRWLRLAFANIDSFLLTSISILMLVGLIVLFSASGQSPERIGAQLTNISVALTVMWIVARIPPQHLLQFAVPVYTLGVILLIGVALFGHISHGARRWLDIGPMHIQPSEIMRTALPLMLADGAGSASRSSIGIVVVFGVALSTLLTLYVIPALYLRVAPYTRAPEARARELEQLERLHVDGEARV